MEPADVRRLVVELERQAHARAAGSAGSGLDVALLEEARAITSHQAVADAFLAFRAALDTVVTSRAYERGALP